MIWAAMPKKCRRFCPLDLLLIYQPQICLVNQGRGLQGMAGPLTPQVMVCQAVQFVIDHWNQSFQRLLVARVPARKQIVNGVGRELWHKYRCGGGWSKQ